MLMLSSEVAAVGVAPQGFDGPAWCCGVYYARCTGFDAADALADDLARLGMVDEDTVVLEA